MKKENILIVSLFYNNGHIGGLMGWYDLLSRVGYTPFFFLDNKYWKHFDDSFEIIKDEKPDFNKFNILIINNLSPKDEVTIKYAKRMNKNMKIIFIHHEPWKGYKEITENLKSSPFVLIKVVIKKMIEKRVLCISDLIICPSENALNIYKKYEYKYNSNCVVFPLVMKDNSNGTYNTKKHYFSYIATATYEKGIDLFLKFSKYCHKRNYDIHFSVITKTDISSYIDESIEKMIQNGYIVVKQGIPLSEEEMDQAYNDSCCTWLVYRSSTQSGVLPKALMWGSPCIATKVGVFPEIIDGKNGILVSAIDSFDEIYQAYKKIKENQILFQQSARETYEKIYKVENRLQEFKKLLDIL